MNNFIWQINDCPELDIDKRLNAFEPHNHLPLDIRQTIERRILWGLLRDLKDVGVEPYGFYDGDERHAETDAKEIMENAFNLDEIHVYFKHKKSNKKVGSIYFIWGNGNNGLDCITDWSWSENEWGDAFNAAVDAFSDKVQG